ncbi:MAG: hypothetical protein WD065_11485 [Planctomycetaceae bacterium]
MTSSSDDFLDSAENDQMGHGEKVGSITDDLSGFVNDQLDLARNGNKLGADGLTYPVAFVHVTFDSKTGNAVGGMLVTDNTGIPLEFLITSAVRPTRAQQILYGKRLKSYISINLCGKQLLNDIKTKPKVIFVHEDLMLGIHAHTSIPVLMLQSTEQLGTVTTHPMVIPPKNKPEYADVIDLTSLDADMVDAFDRIEKCREVLASRNDDYKI